MTRKPSASRASETEVRIFRSSSTRAIVGIDASMYLSRATSPIISSPSPAPGRNCDDEKNEIRRGRYKETHHTAGFTHHNADRFRGRAPASCGQRLGLSLTKCRVAHL